MCSLKPVGVIQELYALLIAHYALLRLQFLLDDPDFTIERLREYVVELTEEIYPHEYHVYRRHWEQLATGSTQGSSHWPKLEYLE